MGLVLQGVLNRSSMRAGVSSLLTTVAVDECFEILSSACKGALESSCPLKTMRGRETSLADHITPENLGILQTDIQEGSLK